MPVPDKPGYSHGSTGTQPDAPIDYQNGDPVDESEFDYFVYTPFNKIKQLIDFLEELDADGDGVVDEADTANLYKDNDIDSNADGKVDAADQADNATNVKGNDIDSDADGKVNAADQADELVGDLELNGSVVKDGTGPVTLDGEVDANGAQLEYEWHSKQEGGTVSGGNFVPLGTFGLDDGESIIVTQATLTRDGFMEPCVSGVNLVIADENDEADPANASPVTVLSGDGSTHYDDETGAPLAQYTNNSGGHLTVAIGLDNGHYGGGYGDAVSAFGGYIARKV